MDGVEMRNFEEAILLVSMFQNVAMLAKECEFIDYDTFKKDPGSYDGYAVYDNEEGEIMFPDRFSGTRDLLLPLPSRPMYLECEGLIRIELQTSMSSSMMEIGGRRSRMSNALSAKERDLKHAEHKRYYARTAFKYERRRWTVDEDKLVLIHRIPDSELSRIIKRSMKSISNRRWRLRKAASENKRTGNAGE